MARQEILRGKEMMSPVLKAIFEAEKEIFGYCKELELSQNFDCGSDAHDFEIISCNNLKDKDEYHVICKICGKKGIHTQYFNGESKFYEEKK